MKSETRERTQIWSDIGATHQSLHRVVTDSLREAILKGRFRPGERLTESNLAYVFQVSRNPIREALRALQVEGLVEVNPRKGARVRLVSRDEADEVIELRADLEGINARNAAKRCDEPTRGTLRKLLQEGNEAARQGDPERLQQLNDRFHTELAVAGRNRYLADFVRMLRERTLWLFASGLSGRIGQSWKEHAEILQAVIDGDADLASLLAIRHVRNVGEVVRTKVREGHAAEAPAPSKPASTPQGRSRSPRKRRRSSLT